MFAFTSCDEKGSDSVVDLTLDTYDTSVVYGSTVTVKITSGNGGYVFESTNSSVATAKIKDGNTIEIESKGVGKAVITVTDKEEKTADIAIEVTGKVVELVLDTYSVAMSTEDTKSVNITKGNGGYTITTSADGIVNASEIGGVITIESFREAGDVTVTVTDSAGKVADIEITITEAEELADLIIGSYSGDLTTKMTVGDATTVTTTVKLTRASATSVNMSFEEFPVGFGETTNLSLEVKDIKLEKSGNAIRLKGTSKNITIPPALMVTVRIVEEDPYVCEVEGDDIKLALVASVFLSADLSVNAAFEGTKVTETE